MIWMASRLLDFCIDAQRTEMIAKKADLDAENSIDGELSKVLLVSRQNLRAQSGLCNVDEVLAESDGVVAGDE